jgi:3-hydroxyacyl-CoA dehydrogenase
MTADITNITVLGTGVLGSQIAYQTAFCGLGVTAYDVSADIAPTADKRFGELAARYEKEVPAAGGGAAARALTRITFSSNLAAAVRDADLVIEAVPELLKIKRDVYSKLGQVAPAKTIFATNTSTMLPSDLAPYTGRPDRFLALHFANEIWQFNTAEVMAHPGTDPAVYQAVVDFAGRIGMEPIELRREQRGYVLNSMLVPFLNASTELLVKGIANTETIDRTWRTGTGAQLGPFQILDVVGLNTAYNISAASGDQTLQAIAKYLKEHYIDEGKLGVASGEGFYKYAETPPTSA